MICLSIDCAVKTFGYSFLMITDTKLIKRNVISPDSITIFDCNTLDISANVNFNIAKMLTRTLNVIPLDDYLYIFVEKQMGINKKISTVYDTIIGMIDLLIYQGNKIRLIVVHPTMKNKFSLVDSTLSAYKSRYRSNYVANKKYALANLLAIYKALNIQMKLDDHVADSIIQVLAYLQYTD